MKQLHIPCVELTSDSGYLSISLIQNYCFERNVCRDEIVWCPYFVPTRTESQNIKGPSPSPKRGATMVCHNPVPMGSPKGSPNGYSQWPTCTYGSPSFWRSPCLCEYTIDAFSRSVDAHTLLFCGTKIKNVIND